MPVPISRIDDLREGWPARYHRAMAKCIGACALAFLAWACGASNPPASSPAPEPPPPRTPATLAEAEVYDASGAVRACEEPKKECPDATKDVKFLDQCRLQGYQVRRCGCEQLCSGNAMAFKPHYDERGNEKECVDEDPACTPPNTSAAFQDACTDAHHRLVICGCEWLCTGRPRFSDEE